MDNIAATFKKIHVNEDENINNDDIWGRLPFCSFYEDDETDEKRDAHDGEHDTGDSIVT
jgi:hypothetical protein